jgi:hypothetical protein
MLVQDLYESQGLMFKVKNAKDKTDLGSLVVPPQDILEASGKRQTLPLPSSTPQMMGTITFQCRPAEKSDIEFYRYWGHGYFKEYQPVITAAGSMRSSQQANKSPYYPQPDITDESDYSYSHGNSNDHKSSKKSIWKLSLFGASTTTKATNNNSSDKMTNLPSSVVAFGDDNATTKPSAPAIQMAPSTDATVDTAADQLQGASLFWMDVCILFTVACPITVYTDLSLLSSSLSSCLVLIRLSGSHLVSLTMKKSLPNSRVVTVSVLISNPDPMDCCCTLVSNDDSIHWRSLERHCSCNQHVCALLFLRSCLLFLLDLVQDFKLGHEPIIQWNSEQGDSHQEETKDGIHVAVPMDESGAGAFLNGNVAGEADPRVQARELDPYKKGEVEDLAETAALTKAGMCPNDCFVGACVIL